MGVGNSSRIHASILQMHESSSQQISPSLE